MPYTSAKSLASIGAGPGVQVFLFREVLPTLVRDARVHAGVRGGAVVAKKEGKAFLWTFSFLFLGHFFEDAFLCFDFWWRFVFVYLLDNFVEMFLQLFQKWCALLGNIVEASLRLL